MLLYGFKVMAGPVVGNLIAQRAVRRAGYENAEGPWVDDSMS